MEKPYEASVVPFIDASDIPCAMMCRISLWIQAHLSHSGLSDWLQSPRGEVADDECTGTEEIRKGVPGTY